jgi:hypothetical protein
MDMVENGLLNVEVFAKRSVGGDDLIGELEQPVRVTDLESGDHGECSVCHYSWIQKLNYHNRKSNEDHYAR